MLLSLYLISIFVNVIVTSPAHDRNNNEELEERSLIRLQIDQWHPDHGTNIWELSGRYEGDINLEDNEANRNGLINKTARWPAGIVPYFIDRDSFNGEQVATIKHAIDEYHQRTCLKFREKRATDPNYIEIVGSDSGCWSSVGMQRSQLYREYRRSRKQVLNLQTPNCVTFGVVLHELMHAIGFYHQQSASNRDEYVKINWENIKAGREHNFKKYAADEVTDFGIEYDYASVMHYSALAFSKNQRPTIEPVREGAKIGLRTNFSDSDVEKINRMYKDECEKRNVVEKDLEDLYWYFGE